MADHRSTLLGGRFELRHKLGEGAMGVVFAAFDRDRHTEVALKELRTKRGDLLLRFKQEWRFLQHLQHPNLVELHELFNEGDQWFFTMELVRGESFLQYVRPGEERPESTSKAPTTPLDPVGPAFISGSYPRPENGIDAADIFAPSPRGVLDEDLLRASLAQLADGLTALHAADMVHRDIKPSNCMVAGSGRVVILDFGLVTNVSDNAEWDEDHLVGTVPYMAPEQANPHKIGPQADLYSVGVVMYEALTGRLPFVGNPIAVLERKQIELPLRPRELDPDIPGDLDDLCMDLLAIDPAARPPAEEIRERLSVLDGGSSRPEAQAVTGPHRIAHFVGRRRELDQLASAFYDAQHHGAVSAIVTGESGVGKSTLVSHFIEGLNARGDVVVLAGRCYEREALPYKGFDGVIDALSRYMHRLDPADAAELRPRRAHLLAQVFPVLEHVDAIADAPRAAVASTDPQELRRQLFAAVRELLARLGDRRPLVLAIDDLQWAGADTMALLAALLAPPDPPCLLLLATARTHHLPGEDELDAARVQTLRSQIPVARAKTHHGEDAMGLPGDVRRIHIEGLAPKEAIALAHRLAPIDFELGERAIEDIAAESDGHPLFIDELIRHASESGEPIGASAEPGERSPVFQLEHALRTRIERLDDQGRALIEVVSLAGGQIAQDVAARAAAVPTDAIDKRVRGLRLANLLRTTKLNGQRWLEPYHDRVRSAAIAKLDNATCASYHRTIADELEAELSAAPDRDGPVASSELEALARHWRGAGEPSRAASYARRAAEEAVQALAFDRAANWFRGAIELLSPDDSSPSSDDIHGLEIRLAQTLAHAGRCGEAGEAYLAAARETAAGDRIELERLAMEQYLRGGHLDRGFAILKSLISAVGMRFPRSRIGAISSLFSQRVLLALRGGLRYRLRDESVIDPGDLVKIDITWSVVAGIAMADPIHGAGFAARNLRLALAAGEPYRLARALAIEAMLLAAGRRRDGQRSARVRALAQELADESGNPHARGLAILAEGAARYWRGEWKGAVSELDRAAQVFRDECTNITDSPTSRLMALLSLFYLGKLPELARRLPTALRAAKDRGDLQLSVNIGCGLSHILALADDDPDRAQAEVELFQQAWKSHIFYFQNFNAFVALTEIDLYRGKWRAALRRVDATWPALRSSLILRIQKIRIDTSFLTMRCALAAAARVPQDRRAPFLRRARRALGRVKAENMPWSIPLAMLGQAALAALTGDSKVAENLLTEAVEAFDRADMALHAVAARYVRGHLIGGDTGRDLAIQAGEWLAERGVKNPGPFARMLVAGVA